MAGRFGCVESVSAAMGPEGGKVKRIAVGLLALWACLPGLAAAATVTVTGIMSGRVMVQVDGVSRFYSVGQTIGGSYRLVEVGNDHVILDARGRKQRVGIGQRALGASPGEETAFLHANAQGHYISNGTINDRPVRFLVDTGATTVAMGAGDARRLGLDKLDGRRASTMTANGVVSSTCVRLDKVSLGDISVEGVDACYADREMPFILLGMSFLSRTEMKNVGSELHLKKRY
jgi:aspartyl protease family protein